MRQVGIGELARQVGMNPSGLRYYESVGLLPPAERAAGGASTRPVPCGGSH